MGTSTNTWRLNEHTWAIPKKPVLVAAALDAPLA